jgi:hypothetical protein
MHRKRDPNAPKDLRDEQRRILCRDPYFGRLREEHAALRRQMCFGEKSIPSARGTEIYRHHSELGKAITRRRQELRCKGFDNLRKAYFNAMPALEIDK